ncbi:hypothetical protein [Aliagarivorans taiwanensis]|uniref:hypothetical protein n=1 Tax=Aliagarivorans taiwanensis TaxID=561966 RepID=UPI00047DD0D9|nr:hypothetical protein [Aliagarivorans taiwanensis]
MEAVDYYQTPVPVELRMRLEETTGFSVESGNALARELSRRLWRQSVLFSQDEVWVTKVKATFAKLMGYPMPPSDLDSVSNTNCYYGYHDASYSPLTFITDQLTRLGLQLRVPVCHAPRHSDDMLTLTPPNIHQSIAAYTLNCAELTRSPTGALPSLLKRMDGFFDKARLPVLVLSHFNKASPMLQQLFVRQYILHPPAELSRPIVLLTGELPSMTQLITSSDDSVPEESWDELVGTVLPVAVDRSVSEALKAHKTKEYSHGA